MIKTQIEYVDGPLLGQCHELACGFGVPNELGVPALVGEELVFYFYKVDKETMTAKYIKTGERRGDR